MAARKFLCFIHVERAGGTTLLELLRHAFPTYLQLRPWYCWANEPENALGPEELAALLRWLPFTRGVGGHTTRPWFDYAGATGREVFCFTFLRDPIARYMSHFNYQRVRAGVPWTIEEFLAERRFDDYHTRRLAGCFDLDRAKRVLDEHVDFAGLTEDFDESLLLLRHALGEPGMRIHYERRNALAGEGELVRFDALSPDLQERVREANRLDLALYAHVRDEVFPRSREAYGPRLGDDLACFQQANRDFRYPALPDRLLRPYRSAFRSWIEPLLHARHFKSRPLRLG